MKELKQNPMIQKCPKRRIKILKNDSGSSEIVAVVALIIVVLVVVAVVFLPGIVTYVKDTVMPGLKTATTNLFGYTG